MALAFRAASASLLCAGFAAAQSLPLKSTAWQLPAKYATATKFDHSLFDEPSGLLYVSVKGSNAELVLRGKGQLAAELAAHAPQGQGLSGGRLFVGSDDGEGLQVFDVASNYNHIATLNFSKVGTGEADDIVVAPNGLVLVSVGDDADGSDDPSQIVSINPATLKTVSATSANGAHVEGFSLMAGSSTVVLASTPDKNVLLKLDLAAQKTLETYTLPATVKGCTPCTWDSANAVALLGCRSPAQFVVLDISGAGEVAYSHSVADDADDLMWDAEGGMVYVSGGGNATSPGSISVFAGSGKAWSYLGAVSPAGKNSWLSKGRRTIFTTVPAAGGNDAFVQLYLTH
jgi:hypothetical protein